MSGSDRQPAGSEISRRQFAAIPLAAGAAALLPISPASGATEQGKTAMTLERRLAIVRDLIGRGYVKGDLSAADAWMAQKHVEHEYLALTDRPGPEIVKDAIIQTRKSLRDFSLDIQDYAENGDKLWTRTLCRGIEAKSGKPISMEIFDVFRFDGDRIVEHWGVPDRFAIFHQIGSLPAG